jgi:hypothetical protein
VTNRSALASFFTGTNWGGADFDDLYFVGVFFTTEKKAIPDWRTIAMETKNGVLSMYDNGTKIKEFPYTGKIGEIKFIGIYFSGSGSIDEVKLFEKGNLITHDTFDSVSSTKQACKNGSIVSPVDKTPVEMTQDRSTTDPFTKVTVPELPVLGSGQSVLSTPEVLKVEPTEAIKNKYTVFTVTGSNLTADNIEFDLDSCVNANGETERTQSTDTKRFFRCMLPTTGEIRGRIYSSSTGKLLKVFRVQVVAKLPTVTSVLPKTATIGVDTEFKVTGKNLVSNMIFSLNDCDRIQEVGAGTEITRTFRCTPKNTEGKKTGKITLKDGTLVKDFSIDVNSKAIAEIKNANLTYYPKTGSLYGGFPVGNLTDIATFSSATPWYIKVNGDKLYSGKLGNDFNEYVGFDSGEAAINLQLNEGAVNINWNKKTIEFRLNGKLTTLISKLGKKSTIEFALGSTKAAFNVDLSKNVKFVTVKTATWSYDPRYIDSVNFLTKETVALRNSLLEKYVYSDIDNKTRLLDSMNLDTIKKDKFYNDAADNVGKAIAIYKLLPAFGKETAKEATAELIKATAPMMVSSSVGFVTSTYSAEAANALQNFTDSLVSNLIDFGSGDIVGVGTNLSISAYKVFLDTFAAIALNDRIETIYANRIAKEVIKQYFANGGSIYDLSGQLISVKTGKNLSPLERNWENAITVIASNMDCRIFVSCEVGYFSEDYDPEVVNTIVQNYLATLRLLSGYGEFYLHNAQ